MSFSLKATILLGMFLSVFTPSVYASDTTWFTSVQLIGSNSVRLNAFMSANENSPWHRLIYLPRYKRWSSTIWSDTIAMSFTPPGGAQLSRPRVFSLNCDCALFTAELRDGSKFTDVQFPPYAADLPVDGETSDFVTGTCDGPLN